MRMENLFVQNDITVTILNSSWKWLVLWLAIANFMAFALFGLDKWKAKRKAKRPGVWRIRERTLWTWALLGGSVGAILGMRVFRHKTRKARFAVGLPLLLLAQIAIPLLLYLRR